MSVCWTPKGPLLKASSVFIIALSAFASVLAMEKASAFHDGGAGECEGCHTIHNSSEGMPVVSTLPQFQSGQYLLKGSDSSSVCLNCHQRSFAAGTTPHQISTAPTDMPAGVPPQQFTPGGDFGWLKKTYTWIPSFGAPLGSSNGDSHGHNIVAGDYGYFADSTKTTAPGGSYPAANLSCISCHDPHGIYRRDSDGSISRTGKPIKSSGSYESSPNPDSAASVGVYRLLGGAGYHPKPVTAGFAFTSNPPAAVAPTNYNRSEETGITRVAYGAGMSEWCRNCHPNIHNGSAAGLRHPSGSGSGILGSQIVSYYNQYVKQGDLTGIEGSSYSSLVPFEIGSANYSALKQAVTGTPTAGPNTGNGTPQVMCLTCHRAHASGWGGATRWNTRSSYIVYDGKYSQAGEPFQPYGQGRTELEAAAANYNTPVTRFSPMQPGLCEKCHSTVPQ
ncbi:cytochrome C [Geobacter sp. DSM 9736]|uniref:cytochrome C n=1 Tax=Geobacter sp. DSM 9736 TaxID=1277350 RepID=UPI000B60DB37|nr:cytochrome C [Geobacter sp. DSM 9736]SNB47145.1 hypothetical protein SAMN06269301_2621 [Geobacter sp. DSM 9736]